MYACSQINNCPVFNHPHQMESLPDREATLRLSCGAPVPGTLENEREVIALALSNSTLGGCRHRTSRVFRQAPSRPLKKVIGALTQLQLIRLPPHSQPQVHIEVHHTELCPATLSADTPIIGLLVYLPGIGGYMFLKGPGLIQQSASSYRTMLSLQK